VQIQTNTGWRRLAPATGIRYPEFDEVKKEDLFKAARAASLALSLRPAARQVLDHIVGCYGGEPIKSRILVWPANEFLMDRTGLSERALRYAVRDLISDGVIKSKESANGKRFAIHSKSGQIVDAYGFDLSPLLARRQEFEEIVASLRETQRQRRSDFDEITICRRYVIEVASQIDSQMLMDEVDRLQALTPRRDSHASPDAILAMWRSLKEVAESQYHTANGGNGSRLIKDNNDSPDQSCSNGRETKDGASVEVKISDLRQACPEAMEYAGDLQTVPDVVRAAAGLRGGFGVHQSAWVEAMERLGSTAGAVFFVALQNYVLDQRNKAQIKNFGGYFRSTVRRVAAGELDLTAEIQALRHRRRN
jgi:replication initiation protein RepC